jgi:membrane-bound lytic murein transglycosylase D
MKIYIFLLLTILMFGCKDEISPKKIVSQTSKQNELPKLPLEMKLFGETIDLQDEDIRERLENELIVNSYFHSSTTLIIKRANRFFPNIEKLLKEENIHDDFKYLSVIESNLTQARSPAGALGFWQFMPQTASEYNLVVNNEIDERLNVQKSCLAACAYLKKSHAEFKNWILTAASYNRGLGGLRSDMENQYATNYFDIEMNNETARYVFRIMAMKLILENPKAYGFNINSSDLYPERKTYSMVINSPIEDLALWAKNNGANLKILRKLNPWLIGNSLTIRPLNYTIDLPIPSYNLKNYLDYKK